LNSLYCHMTSVTIDWVCIGVFIVLLNTQVVTTLYKSLSYRDLCSQSQSSLHWLVMPLNTNFKVRMLHAGGHLTPISYSANYRFKTIS
jgi:hypothetical protein